jgi:hypothetical protein
MGMIAVFAITKPATTRPGNPFSRPPYRNPVSLPWVSSDSESQRLCDIRPDLEVLKPGRIRRQ